MYFSLFWSCKECSKECSFGVYNQCCGLFSTKVLNNIVPCLTKLINLTYSAGIFPEKMKQATITLLLKKPSLDMCIENYSAYQKHHSIEFDPVLTL